ncbi:MAG TPA: DUF4893 domain-containing protein [Sphingomonas sp.]|jgi:hypothetical protein|nr:DUF4893 domain-containing protein [Sphingomonas sp.]
MPRVVFALLCLGMAGCAARTPPPRPAAIVEVAPAPAGWRAMATVADQQRIDQLPASWSRALAGVPKRAQPRLQAEAELVDPAAARDLPAPPPGPYRCRLVRFGGRAAIATFAPDFCYVDGDSQRLSFTKQTGSNLPGGWLYADGNTRLVFLGALPRAGTSDVPLYGSDARQDVSGVLERVSAFRWRLVLTRAGRGAMLDVYELVPVTPEVPGATPAVPAKDRQTAMAARAG